MLPALLGIVCFAFQVHAGRLDHWICLPYSIFVMVRMYLCIICTHIQCGAFNIPNQHSGRFLFAHSGNKSNKGFGPSCLLCSQEWMKLGTSRCYIYENKNGACDGLGAFKRRTARVVSQKSAQQIICAPVMLSCIQPLSFKLLHLMTFIWISIARLNQSAVLCTRHASMMICIYLTPTFPCKS